MPAQIEVSPIPRTWGTFWDHFGETLVHILRIRRGAQILDIGFGGGSTLFPASKRVGATGKVVGVELCEHCMKRTNGEIARCGISNAEVLLMDAKELDFPDASFDYVIAGFIGWDDFFDFESNKFVADDVLTKQIVRVLKPNGRFGLSTWLRQEDLDWMRWFLNSHGIECNKNYHAEYEEGWRIIMRESGLNNLWFLKEDYQYTFRTKEFWWKEMTDYNWIEGHDDCEVLTESIKRDAFEDITDHETDSGGVRFSRTALFMTANKI